MISSRSFEIFLSTHKSLVKFIHWFVRLEIEFLSDFKPSRSLQISRIASMFWELLPQLCSRGSQTCWNNWSAICCLVSTLSAVSMKLSLVICFAKSRQADRLFFYLLSVVIKIDISPRNFLVPNVNQTVFGSFIVAPQWNTTYVSSLRWWIRILVLLLNWHTFFICINRQLRWSGFANPSSRWCWVSLGVHSWYGGRPEQGCCKCCHCTITWTMGQFFRRPEYATSFSLLFIIDRLVEKSTDNRFWTVEVCPSFNLRYVQASISAIVARRETHPF